MITPDPTLPLTGTEEIVARIQRALSAPGVNKAECAKRADVAPSVVKDMARPDWRPKTIQNLIAVERALAAPATGAPE